MKTELYILYMFIYSIVRTSPCATKKIRHNMISYVCPHAPDVNLPYGTAMVGSAAAIIIKDFVLNKLRSVTRIELASPSFKVEVFTLNYHCLIYLINS